MRRRACAGARLELHGVSIHYGSVAALTDVSLCVPRGCTVALLGPNGAGKSTVLRTISGLVRPASGRVTLDGERIDSWAPHRIARAGVLHVPEGRGIFPELTVRSNLEVAARSVGEDVDLVAVAAERFPALKRRLEHRAGSLSGGEQQMLALARAVAARPRVLMVDELSTGLAPIVVDELIGALQSVRDAGTTVLLVEQYVHAALGLADYVYVLRKGRVADVGEPADLTHMALVGSYLGTGT